MNTQTFYIGATTMASDNVTQKAIARQAKSFLDAIGADTALKDELNSLVVTDGIVDINTLITDITTAVHDGTSPDSDVITVEQVGSQLVESQW